MKCEKLVRKYPSIVMFLFTESLQLTLSSLKLPVPRILLPLDTNATFLANQSISVNQPSSVSKLITDMHGFPVTAGYFNSSDHIIRIITNAAIKINGDFTISLHIRFETLQKTTFIWIDHNTAMFLQLMIKSNNFLSIR